MSDLAIPEMLYNFSYTPLQPPPTCGPPWTDTPWYQARVNGKCEDLSKYKSQLMRANQGSGSCPVFNAQLKGGKLDGLCVPTNQTWVATMPGNLPVGPAVVNFDPSVSPLCGSALHEGVIRGAAPSTVCGPNYQGLGGW